MDEKETKDNTPIEPEAPQTPQVPEKKPDTGISFEIGSKAKEPIPQPLKQTPRSVNQLPRIRTYAADMSGAIKKRGETLASIVNKEQPRKQSAYISDIEKAKKTKSLIIIVGISVLVIAGLFAIVGSIFFSQKNDEVVIPKNGIIFSNETSQIILKEKDSLSGELWSFRQNQALSLGEILRIEVIENDTLITGSELALELGLPSTLAREVTSSMIGIHSFDRNQPFIILEVVAYDRALASLLSWEKTSGRDLGEFFKPTNATSSASLLKFEDKIIRNLDVRASGEKWPILYTFPERQMLIITTNEFTLQEILTRLQSSLR